MKSAILLVGTIPAADNSSRIVTYNFTDNSPLTGRNYYRLEQLNIDNSFEYSETLSVSIFHAEFDMKILSKPVKNILKIELQFEKAGKIIIEVKDVSGRSEIARKLQVERGQSVFTLPLESLSRGIHFLKVTKGNRAISNRFVKL